MEPVKGAEKLGIPRGGPGASDPELFTVRGASVRTLLLLAYRVKAYQVAGPDRISLLRYDLTARVPPGATRDSVPIMPQHLLQDRFHLALHHEDREFRGYELAAAKHGLRLKDRLGLGDDVAAGAWIAPSSPGRSASGVAIPDHGGSGVTMSIRSSSMSMPATMLEGILNTPVHDGTGLTGTYDARFRFSQGVPDSNGNGGFDPNLFTTLEQDLGLRLTPTKARVDVIVVDHFNQTPTEN